MNKRKRHAILVGSSSIKEETTVRIMTLIEFTNFVKRIISDLKVPRIMELEKREVRIKVKTGCFEIESDDVKISLGFMSKDEARKCVKTMKHLKVEQPS
jgi:hypothetical protein